MTERSPKRIEFVVDRKAAQATIDVINKVRPMFPELELGQAIIVRNEFPGGMQIHGWDRGIVIPSPTYEDHKAFWEAVSEEVWRLRDEGKDVQGLMWLTRR